jgi:hypothetical protein
MSVNAGVKVFVPLLIKVKCWSWAKFMFTLYYKNVLVMLKITNWCQVGRGKDNHAVLKYGKVSNVFLVNSRRRWFNPRTLEYMDVPHSL